ncbi:RNA polymerase sigma factor [Telmatospirillum siberiense]|uniref:RNA polymerase sigma factor n=1 Tax=Telmatospirillum siberiense TaxID=382514 RepID=UPI00130468C7|nr:sigma-70 family RNA polymerase sigma factor [Telmatospirillum siberiense]
MGPPRLDIGHLFSAHRKELLRFLQRCLGERPEFRETAADLVQDSFLRLSAARGDTSDLIENPRAMLFRIARNLATDTLRHERVTANLFDPGGMDDTLVAADPSPERQVLDRDLLSRLHLAMGELSPLQRQVLTLKRLHGLSHAEIAAQTGLSPAAIEKTLTRALQRLRRVLGDSFP